MEKIAITGLGIVSPSGIDKRVFWSNIKAGRSAVEKIERFDSSLYPSRIAGHVKELEGYSNVSSRLLKKIDLFSHMALVASELALEDAKINLEQENLKRVGIFMGNAIGGWLYAETELRDMYMEGREGVSPFMASAWFPAAPQGQISINYGIKGFSKTIVADRASSLMAIGYAARTIIRGKCDFILAGGMEAPVTPYALLCCNTSGMLTLNNENPHSAYRPFDKNRDGLAIAEGAGVLTLEPQARLAKRGAGVYANIIGYGTTTDAANRILPSPDARQLGRAITIALDDAGLEPRDIDYICADGAGTQLGDATETKAIKEAFGGHAKKVIVSAPKSIYGNMLGASGVLDVITTVLAMEHGVVPPTINYETPDPACELNFCVHKAQEKAIKNAMIINRGRGGINCVLILQKP
ncbi:MAG: beta-ketoacyl-[acyl-carrier-protein] synthase family protein [Candidatus Omnitrophica bacterium]|nr:beta-ketoacyl-[acyl-carrier-protein] synthase family protein [Candidatus Omnitrophota bacterium]MDE2215232.1 beta-ketoacyl-[acyl-carrier-protein] synthase family protein [Candidatus Omnitrophota bacterium]MDE2231033.1 beta-ketoacyl-[acyl-carrier-protein] synthase family protein [Candidatus Omnitrophota bacterium]